MLACIPGKKLKHALSTGKQKSGLPAPLSASLSDAPSPHLSSDLTKSTDITSYIHIERFTPPLVKQSWFLSVPASVPALSDGSGSAQGCIIDIVASAATSLDPDNSDKTDFATTTYQNEALRVMDPKTGELLQVLRTHFKCIPDYRVMPGIKIRIPCILRFESEPYTRAWGSDSSEEQAVPALYATKITFSSFSKYGKIPPCRVPFLLGESLKSDLALVTLAQGNNERTDCFNLTKIFIELQPEDPMPGSIDIMIKANTATGQVVAGSLRSVTVSIEDMFLKAILPPDISVEWAPQYYSDLFDVLWEACGSSVNTGRETFSLNGGKGAVAINGTQSVKLLEVPEDVLINAVEKHLTKYVVRVAGSPLVRLIRQSGVVENVIWDEKEGDEGGIDVDTAGNVASSEKALVAYSREKSGVEIEFAQNEMEKNKYDKNLVDKGKNMGTFCILVFLPPRYHLLFSMEIGYSSTLVRMRTDHWPCLAYVDEYLEALL
jgi:AP-5 complex subunit beta-1